jgi:hypothetical protein
MTGKVEVWPGQTGQSFKEGVLEMTSFVYQTQSSLKGSISRTISSDKYKLRF